MRARKMRCKNKQKTQFGTRVLPVLVTWTRLTERWDRYIFRGRQNHTNECVRALVYEPLCSAWIDSQLGVPDQRRDRWTMGINHAVPIARCAEPSRRPSRRPGTSDASLARGAHKSKSPSSTWPYFAVFFFIKKRARERWGRRKKACCDSNVARRKNKKYTHRSGWQRFSREERQGAGQGVARPRPHANPIRRPSNPPGTFYDSITANEDGKTGKNARKTGGEGKTLFPRMCALLLRCIWRWAMAAAPHPLPAPHVGAAAIP